MAGAGSPRAAASLQRGMTEGLPAPMLTSRAEA